MISEAGEIDMASTAIRRMGNSNGVLLPRAILSDLGLQVGDSLSLALENGRIVLTPVVSAPRAGWAEAAKEIAAAGDDRAVWPEFANAEDETLRW